MSKKPSKNSLLPDWRRLANARINPNCALVSRTQEPVYASCQYCELKLSNCLQFKGQLASGAVLLCVVLLVLVPMPTLVRYAIGVVATIGLFSYLRAVGRESQASIIAQFRLRHQKRQLEKSARIYEASQKLLSSTPEMKVQDVVDEVAREGLQASQVMLFSGEQQLQLVYSSPGIVEGFRDSMTDLARSWLSGADVPSPCHILTEAELDSVEDGVTEGEKAQSGMILPLVMRQESLGVLLLIRSREQPRFTDEDRQPALLFAAQLATCLSNDQLTDQLLITERLSAVGQLAAGVAHEINNPLTYVLGNQFIVQDLIDDLLVAANQHQSWIDCHEGARTQLKDVQEALTDSHEGIERVRAIVEELSVFSKGMTVNQAEPIDARQAMDSAAKMVESQFRNRARLIRRYESIPMIMGDEGRLTQAFLNLLINASQAIEPGRIEENEVVCHVYSSPNSKVCIEIDDTGAGIPEAVAERLFLPFVTSRIDGEGTGLGLAICHRIISSMSGQISFERRSPRGTRFRITFPAATSFQSPSCGDGPPQREPPAAIARKKILVVDDEDMICKVIHRTLSTHHDVVLAPNGVEALARLRETRFDLVLCDLMMPSMTGMEVHSRHFATCPDSDVRFVFMTGGAIDERVAGFIKERREGGYTVLQKPLRNTDYLALFAESVA